LRNKRAMQDRPDTVPIPSPRTAKENVRELRALRRRVEELQSKLRGSRITKTSPTLTNGDAYGTLTQTTSLPEIQPQRHQSLESQSTVLMASRDRAQIESTESKYNMSNLPSMRVSQRSSLRVTEIVFLLRRVTISPGAPTGLLRRTKSRKGRRKSRMRPAASFSTPMGEIENTFIQRLGISVAEVMQRLVTDEVLHAVDARHIHRLLASNDTTARDVVMQLEQAGAITCRAKK